MTPPPFLGEKKKVTDILRFMLGYLDSFFFLLLITGVETSVTFLSKIFFFPF